MHAISLPSYDACTCRHHLWNTPWPEKGPPRSVKVGSVEKGHGSRKQPSTTNSATSRQFHICHPHLWCTQLCAHPCLCLTGFSGTFLLRRAETLRTSSRWALLCFLMAHPGVAGPSQDKEMALGAHLSLWPRVHSSLHSFHKQQPYK